MVSVFFLIHCQNRYWAFFWAKQNCSLGESAWFLKHDSTGTWYFYNYRGTYTGRSLDFGKGSGLTIKLFHRQLQKVRLSFRICCFEWM